MATFFLPSISSSSSFKFLLSQRQQEQHGYRLNWKFQVQPPRKHLTFTVSASVLNKSSRPRRKVKSNEELCNDIKGFLATVGLPEDHVPSLKELSQHGRIDLANIVRRRGYKLIRELLASSTNTDFNGFIADKGIAGQDEKVDDEVEDVPMPVESPSVINYFGSTTADPNSDDHSCMSLESSADTFIKGNESYTLSTQNENVNNIVEDASFSTADSVVNNHSDGSCESSSESSLEENTSSNIYGLHEEADNIAQNITFSTDASIMESYSPSSNFDPSLNFDEHGYTPLEASTTTTLEEKVAKFIHSGELDMIEDNVYEITNESAAKDSKGVNDVDDTVAAKSRTTGAKHLEDLYENKVDSAMRSNGSALTSKQIASFATENYPLRDDHLPAEGTIGADVDKDLDAEAIRRENQEMNHLKVLLHQKELELSRLKEKIEKEKLALSDLQTKAETEISKAQKLISEKDAELNAAEESFSELEEVQIQYSGDGEIVEVTGSFNGWHHRIQMDPQPSSSIIDPIGSRKSRIWSTTLWLYPGTYEIKFIVDGQWKIDPQRESVSRGGMCNNILRVNR